MGIVRRREGGKWRYGVSRRLPPNKLGMKRFRRWYENKTQAKDVLDRLNGAIANGTIDDVLPGLVGQGGVGSHTIRSFWPVFLEQYCKVHVPSWQRYKQSFGFILPELGDIPLSEFRREHLDRFLERRIKLVSKSTANKDMAALKKFFSYAAEVGAVAAHPLTKYRSFRLEEPELRIPTLKEFQRLVEAQPTAQLRAYVALLGETGMRRNEALGLTWANIDMAGRKVLATKTKGKKIRGIPLTDYAIEKLRHVTRFVGSPYVFVYDSGAHRGQRIRKPYKAYREAAESVGLDWVTFHTLRHMRGTEWLRHGADIRDVQMGLGHVSITTTARYLKHTETSVDKALRSAQEAERKERRIDSERDKSGTPEK